LRANRFARCGLVERCVMLEGQADKAPG
jgi:hypothetical protein